MLLSHAGPQDGESFHLEMRAFLVELCCPHTALTQDLSALDSHLNRLLLIGQPFYMTPPTSVSPCRLSTIRVAGCSPLVIEETGTRWLRHTPGTPAC